MRYYILCCYYLYCCIFNLYVKEKLKEKKIKRRKL